MSKVRIRLDMRPRETQMWCSVFAVKYQRFLETQAHDGDMERNYRNAARSAIQAANHMIDVVREVTS